MTKKLKIGVVGLRAGQSHINDYISSELVDELIICDKDEARLKEVEEKFNINKSYTDFTEMLKRENPDAVSICVPNKLHMPLTIQALKAGCHVLCEKPMGRNSKEAKDMLQASTLYKKKLMINFNQRFLPFLRALKEIIDEGKLGNIYFARTVWHRRRGVPWWYPLSRGKEMCGGGPLIDLGVHMLDRTMWLCDFPDPEYVLGNTYTELSDTEAKQRGLAGFDLEDMGVAMIRMKNGMCLELEASWASNSKAEYISTQLYGTKGGALIRVSQGNPKNEIYLEENGKQYNITLAEPMVSPITIRQAFLDAIINDTEVPCTPEQGVIINSILDAVYESAETGAPVKLNC